MSSFWNFIRCKRSAILIVLVTALADCNCTAVMADATAYTDEPIEQSAVSLYRLFEEDPSNSINTVCFFLYFNPFYDHRHSCYPFFFIEHY